MKLIKLILISSLYFSANSFANDKNIDNLIQFFKKNQTLTVCAFTKNGEDTGKNFRNGSTINIGNIEETSNGAVVNFSAHINNYSVDTWLISLKNKGTIYKKGKIILEKENKRYVSNSINVTNNQRAQFTIDGTVYANIIGYNDDSILGSYKNVFFEFTGFSEQCSFQNIQ